METPKYLQTLWSYKWLLAFGLVVAIAAAFFAGFTITNGQVESRAVKSYTAGTTVLVTSPSDTLYQAQLPAQTVEQGVTPPGERRRTAPAATRSCQARARSRPITRWGTRRPAIASDVVTEARPGAGRRMLAATRCTSWPARTSSLTWFQAVHPMPGAPNAWGKLYRIEIRPPPPLADPVEAMWTPVTQRCVLPTFGGDPRRPQRASTC